MNFTLIALRKTALPTRVLAWVALITFAIGAILARDLVLIDHLRGVDARSEVRTIERAPGDKKILKLRPSGFSKRTAWSPTDPPDDDDETDEDSDTVAPPAPVALPPASFVVAPALSGARIARFTARSIVVAIARRHSTPVRGPPVAR